jgi:hypothetical protein
MRRGSISGRVRRKRTPTATSLASAANTVALSRVPTKTNVAVDSPTPRLSKRSTAKPSDVNRDDRNRSCSRVTRPVHVQARPPGTEPARRQIQGKGS